MSATQPLLVNVDTARQMLGGIGKTNLFALLKSGEIESVKLGKRRLIRVSSLHALADRAVAA